MSFCPKCKSEYVDGINMCSDCGIHLVEILEENRIEDNIEVLVTVKTFDNPIDAHILRSRLESEGIECFLLDENIVTVNWLLSSAVGGIKLKVRESDLGKVQEIMEQEVPNIEDLEESE